MATTQERILEAAERLFAERGYDRTSLRAITAAAGANLAAVNYHFKTKEALIQAVLARILGPLNRQRLAMLEASRAQAGRGPVPLERLVRDFLEPVLRLGCNPPRGASLKMLLGRLNAEPRRELHRIFVGELAEVVRQFSQAFRLALPGLPAEDLYWRLLFAVGAATHALGAGPMLALLSGGLADPADVDALVERLSGFVVAGLMAPSTSTVRAGSRRKTLGRTSSAGDRAERCRRPSRK
mgnify:FL=1